MVIHVGYQTGLLVIQADINWSLRGSSWQQTVFFVVQVGNKLFFSWFKLATNCFFRGSSWQQIVFFVVQVVQKRGLSLSLVGHKPASPWLKLVTIRLSRTTVGHNPSLPDSNAAQKKWSWTPWYCGLGNWTWPMCFCGLGNWTWPMCFSLVACTAPCVSTRIITSKRSNNPHPTR